MKTDTQDIETLGINTVRILSADAVQKANSGHPGTPMALAPMGHVLWTKFMEYSPKNPQWPNRDRFILSNGHACMLQYSFLYLTGYDLSLDDIKNFRQMNSKTAGHPEYGLCPGIDVTTGPLGQGFANGVGFAIAQKHLAARYNKPGFDIFNYKIYAICSDGDLMEGVTSEAASMAGHLELGNLIYLYDDNHISIEGDTDITFNEDVGKRFEAYGWHVQTVTDGNDIKAMANALLNAKMETQKPSLIKVRTEIAYGSPNKVNTAGAHGSPLGADEVKLVKEFFGFDPDKSFVVPDEVLKYYHAAGEKGAVLEQKWNDLYKQYKEKFPELAAEYELFSSGELPKGWADNLPVFKASDPKMATRQASGKVLNAIAASLPAMIGGSADLAPSTDTTLKEFASFTSEKRDGRNFHFGIREHSMGSALNGMALTKGVIPYGATFLMFSEYMRPPIRLAAIMKIRPILVYTHDSIGLGEDGTTHQPIEQLISLRSIPNITVIRPADANETSQAWRVALEHKTGPVVLVFTRQGLPIIDQDKYAKATGLEKGAYILSEASKKPDMILIATGSEVSLILQAQTQLEEDGVSTRVVSMPSWELFEKQDAAYKEKVFPKAHKKRLAVEMASPLGWHKYVTDEGDILGMTTFGESAPAEDLYKHFGFTVDNVVKKSEGFDIDLISLEVPDLKMKKIRFLILNIAILCMAVSSDVKAQSSVDTKESARVFVQKFYDWYFGLYTKVPGKKETYPSDVVAIKQRGSYFDTPLRNALIEDARAQAKVEGEIVGLDFDPFLSGQDIGEGYQTGNVKQAGNKFLVDIHDIKKGKSRKAILASEISVIAEVAKVNGHWVFTNFIYPSPDGNGDLLHILRTLREGRGKTTK